VEVRGVLDKEDAVWVEHVVFVDDVEDGIFEILIVGWGDGDRGKRLAFFAELGEPFECVTLEQFKGFFDTCCAKVFFDQRGCFGVELDDRGVGSASAEGFDRERATSAE